MSRWTCPRCDREFGRARQSHTCIPGRSVDDCFTGKSPVQRAIYDAVVGHLAGLGPFHADAVQVGVFLKRERKLAEVRPMARALSLELVLPRVVADRRVTRTIRISTERTVHVIRLTSVGEVDDQLREWLTEAFLDAGD